MWDDFNIILLITSYYSLDHTDVILLHCGNMTSGCSNNYDTEKKKRVQLSVLIIPFTFLGVKI